MTDLTLALKLLADATSAIQGLQKVKSEVQQTGAEARGLGDAFQNTGQDGSAAFNALSVKLTAAMHEIDLLKAKLAAMQVPPRLPTDTEKVGQAAKGSAGQVANLTAQFNDIGMMMASGQNPLMTAIQQGSQVGQVIGPMGAAGAAKALGAGFLAMLSPLNLGIMAAIAFGSTLVQWLVSGGEEVKTLDDGLADLQSAVKNLQTAANRSLAELKKDFGEVTPEVRRLNDEMADLAGAQAILAATEAIRGLKAETQGSWWGALPLTDAKFTDANQTAEFLGVEPELSSSTSRSGKQVNPVIRQFQDAADAALSAQSLDAQIAAFSDLRQIIIDAAGGIGNMTAAQGALKDKIDQTEAALRRQAALQTWRQAPQAARAEAGYVAPTQAEAKALADLLDVRKRATDATRQDIAENTRLADLQRQIVTYGTDSARAALARVSYERDIYEAQLDQDKIVGDLRDKAMDAWDAANGVADAQMAASIEAAKDWAVGLADELADGLAGALGISTADMAGNVSEALGPAAALAIKLWDSVKAMNAARLARMQSPYTEPDADGRVVDRSQWNLGNMGRGLPANYDDPPPAIAPVVPASTSPGGPANPLASLSGQAAKAMSDLDLAIATINVKVKAGLMTTSQAADAVSGAKDQAAQALADLIARLDQLGPSGAAAADTLRANMTGLAADLKATGSDLAAALSDGFKSPFKDFLKGTLDAQDAMSALRDMFLDTLAQMAADQAAASFVQPVLGMLFSSVGSLFSGGGGAVTTSPIPPPAPHALGGVPDAPLSAYRNQVLNQPTLFPMARGMGLMAEAGREAIMPLKDGPGGPGVRAWIGGRESALDLMRGPDGNLGVKLPEAASPEMRALRAFATGGAPGLAEFSNQVLTGPTVFAMPDVGMGQAGEAGREAIMPLKDGPSGPGVRAWIGGRESALNLMRGPDGNLGVKLPEWQSPALRAPQAFARGGVPGQSSGFAAADGEDPVLGARGVGRGAGQPAWPPVIVNVTTPPGATAQVQERREGGEFNLDVVVEMIENRLAANVRSGRGAHAAAMAQTYGLDRRPR